MLKTMKLLVLYRPNSEHARLVEQFLRDFERQGHKGTARVDVMDLNTREGAAMAAVYDIVQYPGMLATTDDGQLVHAWQGELLPTMNEISGYLRG
jgi:hypothetical protein